MDSWTCDWISPPVAEWSFSRHPIRCFWSGWQTQPSREWCCARLVAETGLADLDGWWGMNARLLPFGCLVPSRAKRRRRGRTADSQLLVAEAFFDSSWLQSLQRRRATEGKKEKREKKSPNLLTPILILPQQKLQIETYTQISLFHLADYTKLY